MIMCSFQQRGFRDHAGFAHRTARNRLVHIISMKNDFLESALANIIIQWGPWLAQKQRQLVPMIQEVRDGLAQT